MKMQDIDEVFRADTRCCAWRGLGNGVALGIRKAEFAMGGADVSNTDSFIDEVSEEVRRDRLFGFARRYGWIAVAVVVAIVGGAAWNEWQKSTRTAAAKAMGDAVLTALDTEDPSARQSALLAIQGTADQTALLALLASAEAATSGDATARAAAGAALAKVAEDGSLPLYWRDLAALRRLSVPGMVDDPDQRRAELGALAEAGRPYSALAQEQLALDDLAAGNVDAARTALQNLVLNPQTPAGLRDRASQVIVSMGAAPAEATGN